MKKPLLIIDVQVSCAKNPDIIKKIEKIQYDYDTVYVSRFVNEGSYLLPLTAWDGYEDERLAFTPAPHAKVFDKTTYSSFLPEMKAFDEMHLCGYDTDSCVFKTALDMIENNVRPVVLADLCGSENEEYHKQGLFLLTRNIGKRNIAVSGGV